MTIQDQMKGLLDQTPDIALLAFGDLSSGLILNWSARTHCQREVLDLLADQAAKCFAVLGRDAQNRTKTVTSMIHFTEHGTQIFARATSAADDAICAVCEPGAELEPLFHAACALADEIANAS